MRRWLAALVIGLHILAGTAQARVLVVAPFENATDITDAGGELHHSQVLRAGVIAMLNRAGVDYDLIGSRGPAANPGRLGAMTEYCRTGIVTYNCCGADSFRRSYEAVIHILNHGMTARGTGYRPDSLFSSTKLPLVPQLMIVNSYSALNNSCDCGMNLSTSTGGYNANTNYIGWSQRYRERADLRYRSSFTDGIAAKIDSANHGTVRFLVSGASNVAHAQTDRPTIPLPCIDCDSLLNPATDDSGVVIVEHNDHVPGKKPIVIVSGSHNADDQFDLGTVFMGLAYLDSLCGGTIIKKPLQFSINIRGGFRRNNRATKGGISPDDSTALKACIDSLTSLGPIPITVGVNLDSVSTYAAEKFWWQRDPYIHFTPESWSGVNDSAHVSSGTGGGGANFGSSVDVWGRFRNRAAIGPVDTSFYGAHSLPISSPDSSLTTMLRVSYMRTDSLFPGRVDRMGMAPGFDWSPKNYRSMGMDSFYYALQRAHVLKVVFCNQDSIAAPSQAPANPDGFMPYQTRFKSSLGGEPVTFLGTPFPPDSGSALVEGGHSVDGFANSPQNSWCKNMDAFWSGMMGLRMTPYNEAGGHQGENAEAGVIPVGGTSGVRVNATQSFTRVSVLTIHAGDLGSGVRSDAAARPTHPGWHTLKSVINQSRIANLMANRPVIIIKYTQDLDP